MNAALDIPQAELPCGAPPTRSHSSRLSFRPSRRHRCGSFPGRQLAGRCCGRPRRHAEPCRAAPLELAGRVGAIWAAGSLLGIGWLVMGAASAWRITRRARPADDILWQRPLRQICDACGLRHAVEVRQCTEVPVPMTWGLRRPVILVPTDTASWSEETKRSVLLHELGHIRRGDCLLHLLGRLALAVYWFHPLVWLAAFQMRKTSEQAADDVVLSANVAPPDYAQHLVDIAGQLRGLQSFTQAALPMASRSDLEGRLLAILDRRRSHRGIQRKTCLGLLFVAMLFVLPCALLRRSTVDAANDRHPDVESSAAEKRTLAAHPFRLGHKVVFPADADQPGAVHVRDLLFTIDAGPPSFREMGTHPELRAEITLSGPASQPLPDEQLLLVLFDNAGRPLQSLQAPLAGASVLDRSAAGVLEDIREKNQLWLSPDAKELPNLTYTFHCGDEKPEQCSLRDASNPYFQRGVTLTLGLDSLLKRPSRYRGRLHSRGSGTARTCWCWA